MKNVEFSTGQHRSVRRSDLRSPPDKNSKPAGVALGGLGRQGDRTLPGADGQGVCTPHVLCKHVCFYPDRCESDAECLRA